MACWTVVYVVIHVEEAVDVGGAGQFEAVHVQRAVDRLGGGLGGVGDDGLGIDHCAAVQRQAAAHVDGAG